MKALHRRQLLANPRGLIYANLENDNSVFIFVGDCKPTCVPIFINDELKGLYFSFQNTMVLSRQKQKNSSSGWPVDRVFLNIAKILKRKTNFMDEMIQANVGGIGLIDPRRDPLPPWERDLMKELPKFIHIDDWVLKTQLRQEELKKGIAVSDYCSSINLAITGVILAVVASLPSRNASLRDLDAYTPLASLEADSYLRTSDLNFTYGYELLPYGTKLPPDFAPFISPGTLVKIRVPENLMFLSKNPLLYQGWAYVGLADFKNIRSRLLMRSWKLFILHVYEKLQEIDDPSLHEFMDKVRLKSKLNFQNGLVPSHPRLILGELSGSAPKCLHTLFGGGEKRVIKHYHRWQLAELAVDMGWPLDVLIQEYKDSKTGIIEVKAAYNSYSRKNRLNGRCKIYMNGGLCAYNRETYLNCLSNGLEKPPMIDIEDMSPSISFQIRLSKNVKN
jgi:hypothetical protein